MENILSSVELLGVKTKHFSKIWIIYLVCWIYFGKTKIKVFIRSLCLLSPWNFTTQTTGKAMRTIDYLMGGSIIDVFPGTLSGIVKCVSPSI